VSRVVGGSQKTAERRLSRAEIVATARRLLADEGVEALTMRRLGEACGVRGPALYWHFKDKDELLGQIVDSVIGDLDSGTDGQPWNERLLTLGRSMRRLLVAYPGLGIVAAGGYTLPEAVLAGLDEFIGVLVGAGFTHRQALAIHYAILTFTTGFVVYESSSPLFELAATKPASKDRLKRSARFAPLIAAPHPFLATAAQELDDLTVDEMFEQSLLAIIEGWAMQLSRNTKPKGRK
jgi:TetR/AcrR family tetracycline transcriptional repressor